MARSRATQSQPQSQPDAELSEAARAVVHDAGDPRIDAHLAALGLLPDPESAPEPPPVIEQAPAAAVDPAVDPAELQTLRERVAQLEVQLTDAQGRTRALTAAIALAAVVILVLVVLQLV